tara:strand:+ start:5835 stop:9647 length:3813 start_codon:yes stop_codon:yes gene_type:complete
MSQNPGIFEPFYHYVKKQLNIRKIIVSNTNKFHGQDLTLGHEGEEPSIEEFSRYDTTSQVWGNREDDGSFIRYTDEQLEEKGLENFYNIDPTSFYKLVTEKQCVIQMASGVDIKEENTILDKSNLSEMPGEQMARAYTLGSQGFQGSINDGYGFDLLNERADEQLLSENLYDNQRTSARDGFGHVPIPGITSMNVSTKSEDGSLREATVEFICHNRRQLEILEALYMRPGYPILLQWGWTSYINNNFESKNSTYEIPEEFFDKNSNFKIINDIIRTRKQESGGNYDGFLGYCKNFSFKVREDGGYNCTTEIMAQAEILASLKAATRVIPKLVTFDDLGNNKQITRDADGKIDETTYYETDTEVVTVDDFLFYLKSIKANLDKAGDEIFLNKLSTDSQVRDTNKIKFPDMPLWKRIWYFRTNKYSIQDKNGKIIDITQLNQIAGVYTEGMDEIYQLIQDVKKTSSEELLKTFKGYYSLPDFLLDQNMTGGKFYDLYGKRGTKKGNERRSNFLGFDQYCKGLIMKEMSIDADPTENDSGIRKKIYVRWDLICQILNRRVTPEYKKHHALSELTYFLPNQPTFQNSPNEEGQKDIGEGKLSYIEYTKPKSNPIFPGDTNSVPVGGSFDTNICILPHQLKKFNSLTLNDSSSKKSTGPYRNNAQVTGIDQLKVNSADMFTDTENFSSFSNVNSTEEGIGQIHFNLDYLISTYEDLVLEEYTTSNELGEDKTKRRLKKEFNFHEWITKIWSGVNEACGGYYDFGLHSEHERPHVARIIDFTFSGESKKMSNIFEFDPQGLFSISRNVSFQSKLDEDFASAVSIAAQSSTNINSLEALSFKAFHSDIKNRFTTGEFDEKERLKTISSSLADYTSSMHRYKNTVNTLNAYKQRMYESNYESVLINKGGKNLLKKPITPDSAKDLASSLSDMRLQLESRYPEFVDALQTIRYDGSEEVDGHYTGEYRKETTHYRNAIIPITTTIEIDGIGGISPLNIFKIKPDKLPLGYQNPNICFVVKSENQKVTSGQDWTTEITGYLTLLNDNPNLGSNSENLKIIDQVKQKKLNDRKAYNAKVTGIAWSAMFISYVGLEGAKKIGSFTFNRSSAHTRIFERNKNSTDWEHLDPNTTALKVGDICLQWRKGGSKKAVKYPGPYSGDSHSDIIISISDTGLVELVGGNVGHKVDKKSFQADQGYYDNNTSKWTWKCSDTGGITDKDHGAYKDGSILRCPWSAVFGLIAKGEFEAWDPSWVENSIDAEETMRKYFKIGGKIDLPSTES